MSKVEYGGQVGVGTVATQHPQLDGFGSHLTEAGGCQQSLDCNPGSRWIRNQECGHMSIVELRDLIVSHVALRITL